MRLEHVGTIIVGQGLAGTALAWALRFARQRVMVIDREEPSSASRIAAGLITPVTGQRFVQSRRFPEFWRAATAFYQWVETELRTTFFRTVPMLRLFDSDDERMRFVEKSSREFPELVANSYAELADVDGKNIAVGCELAPAGRLDVPGFLDASRRRFLEENGYRTGNICPQEDVVIEPDGVRLPRFDLTADRLVFCQGFAAAANPWCNTLEFDAAKGEILTVRIPDWREQRAIHRGLWIAPIGEERFLVGATYDRERLGNEPTAAGREELCRQLRALLRRPFEVVDHKAAVRPILQSKQPTCGWNAGCPRIGWFNGLASKGSLQAPWYATEFARAIAGRQDGAV